MRKRLSILIALAAAVMIAVATVMPAFAWDATDSVALACGASQTATGQAQADWFVQGDVATFNTPTNACYYLYAAGEVEYSGGTWQDIYPGAPWIGGGPGEITYAPLPGDVIAVTGTHAACNQTSTICSGFLDTGVTV